MKQVRIKSDARPSRPATRVLVVEDQTAIAMLLADNLEAEGYVVECVSRGDEAELRIAETPPDLVLLDWVLPDSPASKSAEGFGLGRRPRGCRSSC